MKTAEPIVMPFGLWAQTEPRNHELDGGPDSHEKEQFWGKWSPTVKYRDFMLCAVQKQLNRSGGPKEVEVQSYSLGGANVPLWESSLANTIKPSICSSDAALCQISLASCFI